MTSIELVVPLTYNTYKCPSCFNIMKKEDIIDFNNNFIRCTSPKCELVYIPRNKDMYESLSKLLVNYYNFNNAFHCVNCEKCYIPDCVPRNTRYSLCPFCSFKNPHCEIMYDQIKYYLYDKHFQYPCCIECCKFFDNRDYQVYITDDEGNRMFSYYDNYSSSVSKGITICRECVSKHNNLAIDCEIYSGYRIKNSNIDSYEQYGIIYDVPNNEDYPEIEIDSELGRLYLSTCR